MRKTSSVLFDGQQTQCDAGLPLGWRHPLCSPLAQLPVHLSRDVVQTGGLAQTAAQMRIQAGAMERQRRLDAGSKPLSGGAIDALEIGLNL